MCELPYGRVASAQVGGAGGTCVLRGCVPKKLMVFGGEFAEAFRDSVAFGCGWMSMCMVPGCKFAEAILGCMPFRCGRNNSFCLALGLRRTARTPWRLGVAGYAYAWCSAASLLSSMFSAGSFTKTLPNSVACVCVLCRVLN